MWTSLLNCLVDETCGTRFFIKLMAAFMQFCIREDDRFKPPFRAPVGQYEFRDGNVCLHGMSSVHMPPVTFDYRRIRPVV